MGYKKLVGCGVLFMGVFWLADFLYKDALSMGAEESMLSVFLAFSASLKVISCLGVCLVVGVIVAKLLNLGVDKPSGSKVSLDKEDSEKEEIL